MTAGRTARTDTDRLATFTAGWAAMKWLAGHAKERCASCARYHRLVESGHKPSQVVSRRCEPARRAHAAYRAVEQQLLDEQDDFTCDLVDPRRPDLACDGPADWALTERHRRTGRLLGYTIGCRAHVAHAEAKSVARGGTDTYRIEPLHDALRDGAQLMR